MIDSWKVAAACSIVNTLAYLGLAWMILAGARMSLTRNPLAILLTFFLLARAATSTYFFIRLWGPDERLRGFLEWPSQALNVMGAGAVVLYLVYALTRGRAYLHGNLYISRRDVAHRLTVLQDRVLQSLLGAHILAQKNLAAVADQERADALFQEGIRELRTKIAELLRESGVDVAEVRHEQDDRSHS